MPFVGTAGKRFSRKGAKAQRGKGAKRCRVAKGFLCAFAPFAPLREKFRLLRASQAMTSLQTLH